jgi:hypothetical protein
LGIEDDQNVRITRAPVPGLTQPADHLAQLLGGHLRHIISRAQAQRIQ